MAKVSVLVPVYGVENFIERCAVSLFEQTFQDIEYIFVNDKSPDHSIEILKNVIEKYPDKKVFIKIVEHVENRGLAAARNTGVANATGDYILHVDSDDYLELNAIDLLYQKAMEDSADIVACHFLLEWENVSKISKQNIGTDKQNFLELMLRAEAMVGLVNKMFRRSLYIDNNITALEGINLGEDFVTTPRLVFYAERVSLVDLPLYRYIQTNSNSYTKNLSKKNIDNVIFVLEELGQFFQNKTAAKAYQKALLEGKLRKKIELLFSADEKHWAYLKNIFPETAGIKDLDYLSVREKIIYRLLKTQNKSLFYFYRDLYAIFFKRIQSLKGR